MLLRMPYCFSRSSLKFQGHAANKSSIFTQIGRLRTVTLDWIHQCLRNDAQSLKQPKRGALLSFKVMRQISRSQGLQSGPIGPELSVFGRNWSMNSPMVLTWCQKLDVVLKRCPIVFARSSIKFQGHTVQKCIFWPEFSVSRLLLMFKLTDYFEMMDNLMWYIICGLRVFKVIHQIWRSHGTTNRQFWQELSISGLYLQFEFTSGFEMLHKAWCGIEEVPYFFYLFICVCVCVVIHQISRSHGLKYRRFESNLCKITKAGRSYQILQISLVYNEMRISHSVRWKHHNKYHRLLLPLWRHQWHKYQAHDSDDATRGIRDYPP